MELIADDDCNGRVTPADPQLIAEAMDDLYSSRATARRLGENGLKRMDELGINWDHVIRRLLA